MAAKPIIFLILFATLLAFSSARKASSSRHHVTKPSNPKLMSGPVNTTNCVCDPQRFSQQGLSMAQHAYCDSSLPFMVRAKDLVDRMTLEEKVSQLGNTAIGVPRLALPKYEWWSEALHGVSNVGPGTYFDDPIPGATSFPTVILTAASFNKSLWKRIGQAVSNEARAMYNMGRAGLTYWSPNINVVRDPRWGRITETPGEDPFVVGSYAANYVRGLQDVEGFVEIDDLNSRPLKVSACCKHYTAYDVDAWMGVDRYRFNAKVTEQDMLETFQKPFEMCVTEGDVSSVMCSYNRVNGIPTCADHKLLKGTVRGEWNLHGYIVSDCDSIEVMVDAQKWLGDTKEDAVSQVLKAGLDLDCGDFYPKSLKGAVLQGELRESDIDGALRNLYVVLMRLGFFDGHPSYQSLGEKDVCSNENLELAAEAAREGIVLLKNDNDTLPLKSDHIKKIALIGPHANATNAMVGNYAGVPCRLVTPIDGFSKFGEVSYQMGCSDIACNNDTFIFPAMKAAKEADATILVMGIDLSIEAESRDRVDLLLPGFQTQLINQVAEESKGPVILVIMSAGGVDISFAKNNPKIQSILWAGHPGEEGGRAIADVVFGKYNPGGKLPLTWYENGYTDMLPMTSMPLRPVDDLGYPGRTYKFYNGPVVYPFGYGLSYTQFAYNVTSTKTAIDIKLNKYQHCHDLNYTNEAYRDFCPGVLIDDLTCDNEIPIEAAIQNVGKVDGSEVVIVYSRPPNGIAGTHSKQVVGFERVHVPAGGENQMKISLNACKALAIVDNKGNKILPAGQHKITLGDNDYASFLVTVSFSH